MITRGNPIVLVSENPVLSVSIQLILVLAFLDCYEAIIPEVCTDVELKKLPISEGDCVLNIPAAQHDLSSPDRPVMSPYGSGLHHYGVSHYQIKEPLKVIKSVGPPFFMKASSMSSDATQKRIEISQR
ncbi:MAG: hypothetical protein KY397_04120 [Gemmatimonadetes bacterium]|nr:hypothetical protein [Gemmatimonadota bacterium]